VCSPLPHSAPADRRLFFSGARGAVPRRPEAAPPSVRRAGILERGSRNALAARSGARLGPVAGSPSGFILHGSRGMRTCAPCLSGRCPRVGRWLGALYRLARKNPPLPPPRPSNGMAAVGRRCPGVGTASAGRAPGLDVSPSPFVDMASSSRPRRNHLGRAIAARRPCRRRLLRRRFVRAGGP